MPCPICDEKPINCDCTETELRQFATIEEQFRNQEEQRDAASAHEEWHEERWQAVREAEAFLKETEGWI